ncbi:MAG TPA: hypothetical protein VI248_23265 [Kineosporiaceae bacterium]
MKIALYRSSRVPGAGSLRWTVSQASMTRSRVVRLPILGGGGSVMVAGAACLARSETVVLAAR